MGSELGFLHRPLLRDLHQQHLYDQDYEQFKRWCERLYGQRQGHELRLSGRSDGSMSDDGSISDDGSMSDGSSVRTVSTPSPRQETPSMLTGAMGRFKSAIGSAIGSIFGGRPGSARSSVSSEESFASGSEESFGSGSEGSSFGSGSERSSFGSGSEESFGSGSSVGSTGY